MQAAETSDPPRPRSGPHETPPALRRSDETLPALRRPGTIPVTVRLDPPRYDRLKRLVLRLQTTGQSIIQTALDRSMVTLERAPAPRVPILGQSSLFAAPDLDDSDPDGPGPDGEEPRRPVQDSFDFVRPEPTVALTYRATVPMHRWLHRRSAETGQTIQDIITDALKAARGGA